MIRLSRVSAFAEPDPLLYRPKADDRIKQTREARADTSKSSAVPLRVTSKASIALGFVTLTRCACPPRPKAVPGYTRPKGTPVRERPHLFPFSDYLDSMSFQPSRECDEWPNECIISVVGVWTVA